MGAPSKSEYYGEDYSQMSDDQRFELHIQEGREATGLLWDMIQHLGQSDPSAVALLHKLRAELIQDEIDNGESSDTVRYRTMFLYRRNTAGIQPVTLKNGEVLS